MEIISHRGYWLESSEKNTKKAFLRSFLAGYGTETDLRDLNGELVISHDIPKNDSNMLTADDFFQLYVDSGCLGVLALNIKSDGLQSLIKECLERYHIKNYFLFDASIPDSIVSINHGLTTFARSSEFEPKSILWGKCEGIWLDRFSNMSIDLELIQEMIKGGKKVSIVSEELHKRETQPLWNELLKLPREVLMSNNLILCTDVPDEASDCFKDYI